ncbi:MAG TPA: MoxR family ATPase [Gemmataceae bacterium]|jgi:MoxR-like ATPase|nr:MoxR family ATPase [Gemmataceae bacterium]
MESTLEERDALVREHRAKLKPLYDEIERVVVGQRRLIDRLLMGLFTGGHVLLEGVPGLAKTLSVRSLARALDLHYRRIQFTPDLLPADLLGTMIYNPRSGDFTVKKGPIFTQILLADEINRAPAKVQSALLEAMEEKQVTLGETSHQLEQPFLVLATQNPIEHEGTYPLPEAQVDRFMLKLVVSYPERDDECEIVKRIAVQELAETTKPVLSAAAIAELRAAVQSVYVDERIQRYVVDLVRATRAPSAGTDSQALHLRLGASPRAAIFLTRAARFQAFLEGRSYVLPDDVQSVANDVLSHRFVLTYEAEADDVTPESILQNILDRLPVP